MDLSSSPWLSDMAVDELSFIHPCEMSGLHQLSSEHIPVVLHDDFQHSFSSESNTSYPTVTTAAKSTAANAFAGSLVEVPRVAAVETPTKHPKAGSWNNSRKAAAVAPPHPSSPMILSFGGPDPADDPRHLLRSIVGEPTKPEKEAGFSFSSMAAQGVRRAPTSAARPPSHTRDHILAERKRREKISERFIALSAIVPGLKKMDKASVLGDAIKYVKQLEERVKTFEEQAAKRTVESVVLVKKSHLPADDETSSSGENFESAAASSSSHLPEVEAKVSDKSVLVRIHCENRKGVLVRVLAEIEKLHLTVINTSVMPFAGAALDITVMAQMDEEFSTAVEDLVKHLNSACRFM